MLQRLAENIYYYEIPGIRSATIAFIVGSGPVYEPDHLLGISHFIEHTTFRKTKKRSLRQIKLPIEQVGGVLNAWTDKENTVYYAKVPSTFFKTAFNILREMVFEPDFLDKNVELERKIILQEYYSEKEIPEQRLFNLFFEQLIDGPHSKSIIGTEESIKRISKRDLCDFHSEMYSPYNIKIIVAGNVKPQDLRSINTLKLDEGIKTVKHSSELKNEIVYDKFEESQQMHFLFSHRGIPRIDEEESYSSMVLNTLLGSGMSSLLFEQIREKKGLVYDISTNNIQSREWGVFSIYAATSEENAQELTKELFNLFRNFNLKKKLFDYGKKRLLGSLELVTESTSALTSLYIQYVANDLPLRTIDEIIERIQAVTEEQVMKAFERMIQGQWSLAYVTPNDKLKIAQEDICV
ncbi:MAG TPA: pitrilysin family protein [Fervidobacterium sp.]|nr:pitrilysin family protein [Fervidobacterium sp.]HPT53377.1 pitrilysin family protein [Fervidobacterium sp.]HRD19439.1 pitrilysin family protein [Fervidobacterium sp.]